MNILFLTLAYPEGEYARNIYTDLMQEFKERDNNVYVVCQRERRYGKPTEIQIEKGINVLRIKTGNITKTNIIEKGLTTILLESQFIWAIKKYIRHIKIDLLIYSTPPITFERAVKFVKKLNNCKTYLLLKDIFPQNAVDMGMIKKNSLLWNYFRAKEKRLYVISDFIGCMSKANVEYVLKHNREIVPNKVEECPNCIKPAPLCSPNDKGVNMRQKLGIPKDAVIFVYGGNLGRPQGIGFLLDVLDNIKERNDIFFLIVGSGTEYARIEHLIQNKKLLNAKIIKTLSKDGYD